MVWLPDGTQLKGIRCDSHYVPYFCMRDKGYKVLPAFPADDPRASGDASIDDDLWGIFDDQTVRECAGTRGRSVLNDSAAKEYVCTRGCSLVNDQPEDGSGADRTLEQLSLILEGGPPPHGEDALSDTNVMHVPPLAE